MLMRVRTTTRAMNTRPFFPPPLTFNNWKKRPGDEASPIGAYIQLKSGFLTIIQSLESLPNIKIGNFRTLILRMLRGVGRRSKVRGRNRRCLLP